MGAHAVRLSNIDIDNALKNKDFEVLFQPIFDLGNGGLARMETFVRWRHASLGVLPPGAFISFFETQGRMGELSRYVFDVALKEYIEWRGASAPGFSINLALSDLSDEAFSGHFTVALREAGFPAELITLECPMPPVTMDNDAASRHFQRLADTGARLAIEVRGRANDFLRTIEPFPFAEIKTGGAAILRFARTVRGPGLSAISELLELANKNNAAITAVGVEDQASLAALKGLGFVAAQGNHLARVGGIEDFSPSRVNEVRELLDLEPLSQDDLHALFRTGGPKVAKRAGKAAAVVDPQAEEKTSHAKAEAATTERDDLIERLSARISKQSSDAAEAAQAEETAGDTAKPATLTRRQAALRRAAAVARARKQAAALEPEADETAPASKGQPDWAKSKQGAAPRDMQQRLSDEFEAFADEGFDTPEAQIDETPGAATETDDWEIADAADDAADVAYVAKNNHEEEAPSEPIASVEEEETYDANPDGADLHETRSAATVETETAPDDEENNAAAFADDAPEDVGADVGADVVEDVVEDVASSDIADPADQVSETIAQQPEIDDDENDLAAASREDVFARMDGMPTAEAQPFAADKLAPEPEFAPEYDTLSMRNVGARFIPAVHVSQVIPPRRAATDHAAARPAPRVQAAPQPAVPESIAEDIGDTPRVFGRKAATETMREERVANFDAAELVGEEEYAPAQQAEIFEDATPASNQIAARVADDGEDDFDSDAIADDFRRAKMKRRKKHFLTRTVIPFSALRITHFWPRWLTQMMAGKSEA